MDIHSRAGHMEINDIPPTINLNYKKLHLHSATLWNGIHYICIFKHFNICYVYDGLKEYLNQDFQFLYSSHQDMY